MLAMPYIGRRLNIGTHEDYLKQTTCKQHSDHCVSVVSFDQMYNATSLWCMSVKY